MIINHNVTALNTHNKLSAASAAQSKSMEKLASGLRINKAGDDAAGLAISEKMRAQVRGLDQAGRNAQDSISLIQTAEGALNETHDILQRMRELSNQSANGTSTDADRVSMQDELNQLTSEVNRIGNTTEFNTQKLLNGGISSNNSSTLTKATSATTTASIAGGAIAADSAVSIKVDGKTFKLETTSVGVAADGAAVPPVVASTASSNADALVAQLQNVTSGGVKLTDVVDIKNNNGTISFTSKSVGTSSEIEIDSTVFGDSEVKGSPSTVERSGIELATALDASASGITTSNDSTFKISVGSESAVNVTLKEGKTYDTGNADVNISKAAMQDLVKDMNASLQDAGLSDKVTASLSEDNKLQFISETGKDVSLVDGANTPLATLGSTGSNVEGNISQVVSAGAQGSGYSTKFQIGANTGQSMSLTVGDMRASALGITGNAGQAGFTKDNSITNGTNDVKAEAGLNISNKEDAAKSISVIDKAIATVSSERGKLGSVQNRLEHTINNLKTSSENLTAAESRIRDVDMAKEMMNQTKNSILAQAAQAMLAQSNQTPQGVLQLLR